MKKINRVKSMFIVKAKPGNSIWYLPSVIAAPEDNMSRISNLEAAARAKAVDRIAALIQRPDQLEKVEEFRKREARKKASKEAMLKTALQSQLDGVQTGLELLKQARADLTDVGKHTAEIQRCLKDIPALGKELQEIREESFLHSQLVMATDNMNNIFNINKNLEKAHSMIGDGEGKLLHAHIMLSELETSRDELLFELYRMGNRTEQTMLLDYFSDVEKLSDSLKRQLTLNLKRTINVARKEPALLVTTLRIIEREEKADAHSTQRTEISGFRPPGRPKKWKALAFDILESSVAERLEACQLESRDENKMWLVRYLEVMRQLILEDLLVVKSLCVPCFPPSYDILQRYVNMYHGCLSKLLEECISGLEGYEYISLLAWVLNTYSGPELLRNTDLNLSPEQIPKHVLSDVYLQDLKKKYLANIDGKYRSWRMNTLSKEVEEWWKNSSPISDGDSHFHTEAPIIIFKMVDENLHLAETVSTELVQEMLLLSLDMIRAYGQEYEKEVKDFKVKYFEDRSKVQNFTQFIIAVVNNCVSFMELAAQTIDKYWKSAVGDSEAAHRFENVLKTFEALQGIAAECLLEEAFEDLEPHFQELISRNWIKSRTAVDTICVTLEDYFQDYVHLKHKNFELVMTRGKNLVAKKYLVAVMSRKVSFKNQDERREASDKIVHEVAQIRRLFERVGAAVQGKQSACPFNAIDAVSELIKVEDLDILSLELHSFIKHYPDLTKEQLMAILSLRGDIGRFDLKQKASEIIPGTTSIQRGPIPHSIFSQVHVPPSLFNV